MRTSLLLFVCVLPLAAPFAPLPAAAADGKTASPATPPAAPQPSKDRADLLFAEGLAAFDAGRIEEAHAKFAAAWELKQTHDIATNLGVAELKRGRNVEAATHLSWALAHLPPTESSAARQGAQAQLARARALVGALRVAVNVEGAEVSVNGHPAGTSPIAGEVFVEPGPVEVSARRSGYVPSRQSIAVPKGEARNLALTLATATVETPARRSVVPGVVLGVAGGVAVIAGIGLMAGAGSKASSASDLHDAITGAGRTCTAGVPSYDGRCEELGSTAKSANLFRDAGAGVLIAGGLLGAGAAAYFLWPEPGAQKKTSSSPRVVPISLGGGGGVLVLGSF